MKIPEWAAKFASRKLAALAATLLAHFFISKGMATGQPEGWQEALTQGLMSLADAAVAIIYLKEQGKIDQVEKTNAVPKDVGQVGVDAVIDAAKASKKK